MSGLKRYAPVYFENVGLQERGTVQGLGIRYLMNTLPSTNIKFYEGSGSKYLENNCINTNNCDFPTLTEDENSALFVIAFHY